MKKTLDKLGLAITNLTDINQFCLDQNQMPRDKGIKFFSKMNPMNANAAMVCDANVQPRYLSYQATVFSPPLSEYQLELGEGLQSVTEREEYALFTKVNDVILEKHSSLAQKFRTSADVLWIKEHESLISVVGSDKKI